MPQIVSDLDEAIICLLQARMNVSSSVARIKKQLEAKQQVINTMMKKPLFYIPSREKQLFEKILAHNARFGSWLSDTIATNIWREIMSASIALQTRTVIAVAGFTGGFTHQAAKARFGASIDYVCADEHTENRGRIEAVWEAVRSGTAQYGVVPFYHQYHGNDYWTLEQLASPENKLSIYAELYLQKEYLLLGRACRHIRRVYASPSALSNCIGWLKRQLPGAELIVEPSLPTAARKARDNACAVIAGHSAAEEYNLDILDTVTSDSFPDRGEACRFIVIASRCDTRTGEDKTFVMFNPFERPGSLHDSMQVFKKHNINLTRLESKNNATRSTLWDYVFVELEGHQTDSAVVAAINELSLNCHWLRMVGSCTTNPLNPAYSPYRIE